MPAPDQRIALAEWANVHTHLMWCYDGAVDPHGRHGTVHAVDITAWLVRQGSVEVQLGGKTWHAGPGEWLFPPQGERWQHFSDDARILSVRFKAKWPTGEDFFREGLGLALLSSEHPQLLRAAAPLARFVKQNFPKAAIDLMQEPARLETHLRLQTLFSRWFETVVGALTSAGVMPSRMGRIDQRLLRCVRLLDRMPLANSMSETELAASANLSVSQLNRLFLRQFGVSSRGYFERRRHQHALAVLESSSDAVKEIAYALGFSSLPHFSAWFSRRQGVSPREYRTAARAGNAPHGRIA